MEAIHENFDFVEMFEKRLAEYTGFKCAVCVDCCTNALLIACEAAKSIGALDRRDPLYVPNNTYLSVPMTLFIHSWNVKFYYDEWEGFYQLGNTGIYDAATDLHENMRADYPDDSIVCISFQQKKRLPLGRGGAILLDSEKVADFFKLLRYDGRTMPMSDAKQVAECPDTIIRGFHAYMEPDKAAKGILLLNQEKSLAPYVKHTWIEYPDISKLRCWDV